MCWWVDCHFHYIFGKFQIINYEWLAWIKFLVDCYRNYCVIVFYCCFYIGERHQGQYGLYWRQTRFITFVIIPHGIPLPSNNPPGIFRIFKIQTRWKLEMSKHRTGPYWLVSSNWRPRLTVKSDARWNSLLSLPNKTYIITINTNNTLKLTLILKSDYFYKQESSTYSTLQQALHFAYHLKASNIKYYTLRIEAIRLSLFFSTGNIRDRLPVQSLYRLLLFLMFAEVFS